MHFRTVAPRDCLLAIALPETIEELSADLRSCNHDFAKCVCRGFSGSPEHAFALQLQPSLVVLDRIAQQLRDLGGRVVRSLDLDGWRHLFQNPNCVPRVITLFAHGTGPMVELRSGLHPVELLAKALPPRLDTSFELVSCHSAGNPEESSPKCLADAMKTRAPAISAACMNTETRLTLRLHLYGMVVAQLARQPADFLTTVVDVWSNLMKTLRESNP